MAAPTYDARYCRVAAETATAAVFAAAAGPLSAWLCYLTLAPRQLAAFGLAPFALSLLLFGTFALFRLPRLGASVFTIALTTLGGLAGVVVGAFVSILLVGCRFGYCINL